MKQLRSALTVRFLYHFDRMPIADQAKALEILSNLHLEAQTRPDGHRLPSVSEYRTLVPSGSQEIHGDGAST